MMRREEFIVVMRRIWLQNPVFAKKHDQSPREENELFVEFADAVVGDLVDDFEVDELIVFLREKRHTLRMEKKKDLVWRVIFDSILEDIIATMQTIATMPEESRPEVVSHEVEDGYCAICGEKLENTYGNNPEPIFDDALIQAGIRCCNDCDRTFVTPVRAIVWKEESFQSSVKNMVRNIFSQD